MDAKRLEELEALTANSYVIHELIAEVRRLQEENKKLQADNNRLYEMYEDENSP